MKAFSFKGIWILLKDSFGSFIDDKVPKLGGSLAYFSLFSLGPMVLVVIFLAGLILGQQAVEGSLYNQLQELVGESVARQLQQIIRSAATSEKSTIAALIGIVTLLAGVTSVFAEIQGSINAMWHLKLKPKLGWHLMLKNRVLSFGIAACMGFFLLISLAAAAIIESFGKDMAKIVPGMNVKIYYLTSQTFIMLIAAILFALIFKVLPAANIRWRDVWPGAVAAVLLFMAGRFAISFYIRKSDIGSAYGVAGFLVVLLVWIYYSSLILYFGAEFTKAYAKRFGSGIQPNVHAVSTVELVV